MTRHLLAILALVGCARVSPCPSRVLPASPERAPVHGLANIQRTMRLLESGQHVRILFYGQSITQSAWSRQVAVDLQARYPSARIELQNRALGGFSSERLLETADSDLYPWQPDLVIFHVYGAHDRYQQLIERIRARTSAEVLLQTDHVTSDRDLDEPLGACENPADAAHWSGFMNQAFLPSLVARHQVALCDLRASWKLYLRREGLRASALLADPVHLNALGDRRMATLVESCLVRDATLRSPAEDWVQTLAPAPRVEFRGHRVEAVVAAGVGITRVRIDGAPPSTLGLASFARAHVKGGDKWPPLHGIEHRHPLVPELFTFALRRDGSAYRFTLHGTLSGDEGEGRTDAAFVSRSERVQLEPTDWDIPYAFELMGRSAPDTFEVELRVEAHAVDAFQAGERERRVVLASGLPPGPHVLELEGEAPVQALTVYRAARRPLEI
jgi:hypothetical protein